MFCPGGRLGSSSLKDLYLLTERVEEKRAFLGEWKPEGGD